MISPILVAVNLKPSSTEFGSFYRATEGVSLGLNRLRFDDGVIVYERPGCGRLKIEAIVNGSGS